jgi:hypothetical protein
MGILTSSRNGDSRLMHRDAELAKAKAQCTKTTDNPDRAATYLVAHYTRFKTGWLMETSIE